LWWLSLLGGSSSVCPFRRAVPAGRVRRGLRLGVLGLSLGESLTQSSPSFRLLLKLAEVQPQVLAQHIPRHLGHHRAHGRVLTLEPAEQLDQLLALAGLRRTSERLLSREVVLALLLGRKLAGLLIEGGRADGVRRMTRELRRALIGDSTDAVVR